MRRRYYRLLLRLYPRRLRAELGAEMERSFAALDAEQQGRVPGTIRLLAHETVDAIRCAWRERHGGSARARSARRPHRRPRVPGANLRALGLDVRLAARDVRRHPGFAATVVATLALGIGASTLIFSVADAVLFRPLPYAAPEQLVMFGSEYGRSGRLSPLTPLDFLDARERLTTLAGVAASASATLDATGDGAPRRFAAARVSANFFDLLGVEPVLGRSFSAAEELRGADRVAVVSHAAWRSHWGSDTGLIGSTVTFNRTPYTIIGVMPARFHPPEAIGYQPDAEVWIPLAIDRTDEHVNRNSSYLWTIGRRAPGLDSNAVAAEIEALSAAFQREFYDGQAEFSFRVEPLFERTVGDMGGKLGVLLGAVALLLLIACANVANLALARGTDRSAEIAMRAALGAGRARVMRQLLLESTFLGLLAGAAGAALAFAGVRAIPFIDPGLPRLDEIAVDLRVLAFALAVAAATGVVFGLWPAVRCAAGGAGEVLRAGPGRAVAGGRDRLRAALLVGQTALALVLLIGAGLLINSLVRLHRVDPGFDPDNLISMRVYIPPESPTGSRWAPSSEAEWRGWGTFFAALLERVEAIPGVVAAGGTTAPPITGASIWMSIVVEGRVADEAPDYYADNKVSPGYFAAIGGRLVRGREFTPADAAGPARAVVNEAFAARFWPGEDALGKRFQYGNVPEPEGEWLRVVGVVGNTAQAAPGVAPQPEFFVPFFLSPMREMTVLARYRGDPADIAEQMRAAVWALNDDLPVDRVEAVTETIANAIVQPRFYTLLMSGFAVVAAALALVGTYGTVAYVVGRRRREIGIRQALGAGRADILRLVLRQGVGKTALGLVIGALAARGLARVLENLVFGIEPTDPATFIAVLAALAFVAALACLVPARRAAKIDPALTLRSE